MLVRQLDQITQTFQQMEVTIVKIAPVEQLQNFKATLGNTLVVEIDVPFCARFPLKSLTSATSDCYCA